MKCQSRTQSPKRLGRVDILVNNAGIWRGGSVIEHDLASWQHVLNINLTGAFLCTKHTARYMKSQGSGKIIDIASLYALISPSEGLMPAYVASKHGIIGLMKANAVELAPRGDDRAPGHHG